MSKAERGHTAALRYGDTPLLRGYSLLRNVPDVFLAAECPLLTGIFAFI